MKEIFARGPIVCSIAATPDFDNNYPSEAAKNEGVFLEMKDLSKDQVRAVAALSFWKACKGIRFAVTMCDVPDMRHAMGCSAGEPQC